MIYNIHMWQPFLQVVCLRGLLVNNPRGLPLLTFLVEMRGVEPAIGDWTRRGDPGVAWWRRGDPGVAWWRRGVPTSGDWTKLGDPGVARWRRGVPASGDRTKTRGDPGVGELNKSRSLVRKSSSLYSSLSSSSLSMSSSSSAGSRFPVSVASSIAWSICALRYSLYATLLWKLSTFTSLLVLAYWVNSSGQSSSSFSNFRSYLWKSLSQCCFRSCTISSGVIYWSDMHSYHFDITNLISTVYLIYTWL